LSLEFESITTFAAAMNRRKTKIITQIPKMRCIVKNARGREQGERI